MLINVMCAVNIRGHEANSYEAEARCHEAEIEAEARKSEAEVTTTTDHENNRSLRSRSISRPTCSSTRLGLEQDV